MFEDARKINKICENVDPSDFVTRDTHYKLKILTSYIKSFKLFKTNNRVKLK